VVGAGLTVTLQVARLPAARLDGEQVNPVTKGTPSTLVSTAELRPLLSVPVTVAEPGMIAAAENDADRAPVVIVILAGTVIADDEEPNAITEGVLTGDTSVPVHVAFWPTLTVSGEQRRDCSMPGALDGVVLGLMAACSFQPGFPPSPAYAPLKTIARLASLLAVPLKSRAESVSDAKAERSNALPCAEPALG
jgi:hypothetical protein